MDSAASRVGGGQNLSARTMLYRSRRISVITSQSSQLMPHERNSKRFGAAPRSRCSITVITAHAWSIFYFRWMPDRLWCSGRAGHPRAGGQRRRLPGEQAGPVSPPGSAGCRIALPTTGQNTDFWFRRRYWSPRPHPSSTSLPRRSLHTYSSCCCFTICLSTCLKILPLNTLQRFVTSVFRNASVYCSATAYLFNPSKAVF